MVEGPQDHPDAAIHRADPDHLFEVHQQRVDEVDFYWRIVLLQRQLALAVLVLLTFVIQINEFIEPLTITKATEMRTRIIGLTLFDQEYFTQWQYTATGALLLFLPCLALFIATRRWFGRGIVLSGLK